MPARRPRLPGPPPRYELIRALHSIRTVLEELLEVTRLPRRARAISEQLIAEISLLLERNGRSRW